MSETPKRPSGPPHNPGVRELVAAKLRWSSPQTRDVALLGFRGWHERGFLAHRDEPGLTQFVTFRLADSFPAALRSEWEHLLAIEDDQECVRQLERYLDKGRGSCHLRKPEIASLVEEAFRLFHRERYDLRAWVIMPNHVHVLFKVEPVPMSQIIASWKNSRARRAISCWVGAVRFGRRIAGIHTCVTPPTNGRRSGILRTTPPRPVWCSPPRRGPRAARAFGISLACSRFRIRRLTARLMNPPTHCSAHRHDQRMRQLRRTAVLPNRSAWNCNQRAAPMK
jgi:hypothetical protein